MEQTKNDQVRVGPGTTPDGQQGVMLSIPSAPITNTEGEHFCDGMIMPATEAIQLAHSLLFWAELRNGQSLFAKRYTVVEAENPPAHNRAQAITDFLNPETDKGSKQ